MQASLEHYSGANAHQAIIGDCSVWFSYRTPVAFQRGNEPIIVRVNDWGRTTGKHINDIDGGDMQARDRRLSSEEFEKEFKEFCKPFRSF